MTATLKITTFAEALRAVRERAGYTHREIADRAGVSKSVARDWERDEIPLTYPTGGEFKRVATLKGMRPLLSYAHLVPSAHRGAAALSGDPIPEAPPGEMPAPIAEHPAPSTFGEALTRERIAAGFDDAEASDVFGVDEDTYAKWEVNVQTPTDAQLRALVEAFPALATAPPPAVPGAPYPTKEEMTMLPDPAPKTKSEPYFPPFTPRADEDRRSDDPRRRLDRVEQREAETRAIVDAPKPSPAEMEERAAEMRKALEADRAVERAAQAGLDYAHALVAMERAFAGVAEHEAALKAAKRDLQNAEAAAKDAMARLNDAAKAAGTRART